MWATAAAFTAAFLSLVNVGYSFRLTSRGTREQWRRDHELPVVAKCLALSREAAAYYYVTLNAIKDDSIKPWSRESWVGSDAAKYWELANKASVSLGRQVAQLDLLASRPVREAARTLAERHREYSVALRLPGAADNEQGDPMKLFEGMHGVLIDAARADIGLDPVITEDARSLKWAPRALPQRRLRQQRQS